jgi:Fe-S-cluster-containing hydrogenase component 2
MVIALKDIWQEVELGFDVRLAFAAQRRLNCDVQTVFSDRLCIECDACVDICPMDCITFTANGEEADLRAIARAGPAARAGPLRLGHAARPRSGRGRACIAACAPSAPPARGT